MAATLAPLFVNHARVRVRGDPKPSVSKVLEAMGKNPDQCEMYRLQTEDDPAGTPVGTQDVIDRAHESSPVHFRVSDKEKGPPAAAPPSPEGEPTAETNPEGATTTENQKDSPPEPGKGGGSEASAD